MTTPADIDDELSVILLGDYFSPGVATISGHDRNKAWDNQAAKGTTGASSTLNGDPIGTFQVTFDLADDDDFDGWDPFQQLIESTTNGPAPVALPIYHPDLARNGFRDVVSAGISGMVYDGKGGAKVTVKFQEHRPPKPKIPQRATAKPGTGTAGAVGADGAVTPPKPDPNAAARAELAALLTRAQGPL